MSEKIDRKALLGIGIEEDTAIVVRGNQFQVLGKSDGAVFVYDPRRWTPDLPDDWKYLKLPTRARYDLKTRSLIEAVQLRRF